MLPAMFRLIWPSGFRGGDLKNLANQKQELPVAAMFVNGSGQNVQSLERTPSDGKSSHSIVIYELIARKSQIMTEKCI
jgi:hypothetical protein